MIETESLTSTSMSTAEITATQTLLTGPLAVEKLSKVLQDKGLDADYVVLDLQDESGATDLSYRRLAPVLARAQEQGHQLVIAAQPREHKLSVAIRQSIDGPFQVLNTHQLAVLLADTITDQAAEKDFACIKSVVLCDMLDTLLNKKGFQGKTELLFSENLQQAVAATAAETAATTVLAITENGEFCCNKGFDYLVEQLMQLQQTVAASEQTLFDRLLDLYSRYGYYREKTLVVSLGQANQVAHYKRLMEYFRKTKSAEIASYTIKEITDYQRKRSVNFTTGKQLSLDTQPANVIKVVFDEGINLVLAPAEEKIYLYLSLGGKLMRKENYSSMSRDFDQRLLKLVEIVNKL